MKLQYFSHDVNARNDEKIKLLRMKYSLVGYGLYFALLEMMAAESDYSILASEQGILSIEYELRSGIDIATFLQDCIDIGLFQRDGERIYSESFKRRQVEAQKRKQSYVERGKKGANTRWKDKQTDPLDLRNDTDTEWVRVAKSYEDNIGLLPSGMSMKFLIDAYEAMGADVVLKAIEITNGKQAAFPYLKKILENWMQRGFKTIADIEAAEKKHEYGKQDKQQDAPPPVLKGWV